MNNEKVEKEKEVKDRNELQVKGLKTSTMGLGSQAKRSEKERRGEREKRSVYVPEWERRRKGLCVEEDLEDNKRRDWDNKVEIGGNSEYAVSRD